MPRRNPSFVERLPEWQLNCRHKHGRGKKQPDGVIKRRCEKCGLVSYRGERSLAKFQADVERVKATRIGGGKRDNGPLQHAHPAD